MADMGFMPQVVWLLDRITADHQTMLFSATLDSEIDRLVRNYTRDPVRHEVESVQPTVEEMEHRFLKVHELDKVKVAAAIAKGAGPHAVLLPHQAGRRPARAAAPAGGHQGRRAPRRPGPERPPAGPQELPGGRAGRPGGHRRGRPRPRRRRHRRGRALRPARGPHRLPPPLGPHRPGRRHRRGRQPPALGPAARERAHAPPPRHPPAGRGAVLQRRPPVPTCSRPSGRRCPTRPPAPTAATAARRLDASTATQARTRTLRSMGARRRRR